LHYGQAYHRFLLAERTVANLMMTETMEATGFRWKIEEVNAIERT
jgi:hypothetical protein